MAKYLLMLLVKLRRLLRRSWQTYDYDLVKSQIPNKFRAIAGIGLFYTRIFTGAFQK